MNAPPLLPHTHSAPHIVIPMAIKQLNKTKKVVKAEKKVIPPPASESSEQESDQSEQEDAEADAEEDAEEETETTADKEVTKSENVTFKDLVSQIFLQFLYIQAKRNLTNL